MKFWYYWQFFSRRNEIILWNKKHTALFQTHNWKKSIFFNKLGYVKIRDRQIGLSLWDWVRAKACLRCCHWMLICKQVGVGWGGDDETEFVSDTKRIKSCVPYFEGNALSKGRKRRSSGFWGKSLLSPAGAGDVPPIKPQLPPSPQDSSGFKTGKTWAKIGRIRCMRGAVVPSLSHYSVLPCKVVHWEIRP